MNNLLDHFRGLPRNQLIREIRKACEDDLIVLWEDVYYGAIYYPVKAGVIAAQRLGIKPGQVVGY